MSAAQSNASLVDYDGGPDRPQKHLISPQQARRTLQKLGPTFVKIGQFLALRPDLVPQEYCNEFLTLTDQASAAPFSTVRQIIEEDLGSLESHFSSFNPRPLAAASLAQVHEAFTHDGARVAVKVQRVAIREAVEHDLQLARALAWVFKLIDSSAVVAPQSLVQELGRWMHDELDLKRELRNLTRMYGLAHRERNMQIPQPYPQLSS